MGKIRIIHVVHNFLRGGIESFLYYTVKEQLLNPSLEIAILCCQPKEKVVNRRIESLNVPIYYIDINPFEYRLTKLNEAVKIIDRFDIAHLQIYQPTLSWWILKKSHAKIVSTVHSAGTILRKKSLKDKFKQFSYIKFLNQNDGVAHNSPFTQNFWDVHGVSKRSSNVVVYNGVNFNEAYDKGNVYQEYPELEGKIIIGTTSRLISWKRVDLLIKVFADIQKELPVNTVLSIVGDGPDLAQLKQQVASRNLQEKVMFLGYKPNVTDYQAAIDICVFPSAEEPFGLVSIECLHLGKKVFVMADGGGFVDIVGTCDKSLVCLNEEDLGKKLIQSTRDLDADTKQAERIQYSQKFSVRKSAEGYFQLYQAVVK